MKVQKKKDYVPRIGFAKTNQNYLKIFEIAKADKELLICVRGNEFHIYYRGGKILGIRPHSLCFDPKYLRRKDGSRREFSFSDIRTSYRKPTLDCNRIYANPEAFFTEAKSIMNDWFEENHKQERSDQHLIACNNLSTENGFAVVDIEFAVSFKSNYYNRNYIERSGKGSKSATYTKYPNPRFDIIAIDKIGKVHVLELKTGLNALSNVKKHVEDFNNMIGNAEYGDDTKIKERRYVSFLKEIQAMIDTINTHKLRGDTILPNVTISKPEFHFIFTPKEGGSQPKAEQEEEFQKIISKETPGTDIAKIDENYILNI